MYINFTWLLGLFEICTPVNYCCEEKNCMRIIWNFDVHRMVRFCGINRLRATSYGHFVSPIPGGLLAERFGAKWIITGFMLLSTITTLLTPVAARISLVLLIMLRILCGFGSVWFIIIIIIIIIINPPHFSMIIRINGTQHVGWMGQSLAVWQK